MAGDRNILQGLRIAAGGWLHSVDLRAPRGEEVVFRLLTPSTSPRRGNNQTTTPKPSFSSSLAAKGMMTLFQPWGYPLPIPALVLVPRGTHRVPHSLYGTGLTEQEAPQVLGRSP